MKKVILILTTLVFMMPICYSIAKHFWRGTTMSLNKVCQRWGGAPLSIEKFKKAPNDSIRAEMTCSLLKKKKQFIGKHANEIRELFGPSDGHYFSEMFPTYMIEIARKQGQDAWQIVFLIDRNEKISEIIVHKNCCN